MKRKLFAALCAIGFAGAAQAAPVSFGSLSSNDDGSTEIISDALNNLEWLRWDVEADLTYQQTVDLISTGARAGEGWAIADAAKARAFTDALFGTNPCSNATTAGVTNCGIGSVTGSATYFSDLLGDNFDGFGDFAWFLNGPAEASGLNVGVLQKEQTFNGTFYMGNNNYTLPYTDAFSASGIDSFRPISWLLYRDAPAPVPVPASLPLLAVGLGGLGYLARRRRKLR